MFTLEFVFISFNIKSISEEIRKIRFIGKYVLLRFIVKSRKVSNRLRPEMNISSYCTKLLYLKYKYLILKSLMSFLVYFT